MLALTGKNEENTEENAQTILHLMRLEAPYQRYAFRHINSPLGLVWLRDAPMLIRRRNKIKRNYIVNVICGMRTENSIEYERRA